jgi:hypothetical protein
MNNFEELKNKDLAIDYLADNLKSGTLVLFIGSGVSKGFGLPSWIQLVNSLRAKVSLPEVTSFTTEDLQRAADQVIDKLGAKEELLDLLEEYLYQDLKSLPISDILNNNLLVSICALLMGGKRGHISRVVTLNYDSMLEWVLSIFGFAVKTIYKLPELEGSEDVRIYHPHGYVPHPLINGNRSDFAILGMDSVNKRLGTPGEPWFEMTRHFLDTGLCLFIGLSANSLYDRAIAPLFNTSGDKHSTVRPLGIWIVKDDLPPDTEADFLRTNIIPIHISEEKDISEFLLQICQKALQKTI